MTLRHEIESREARVVRNENRELRAEIERLRIANTELTRRASRQRETIDKLQVERMRVDDEIKRLRGILELRL